MGWERKAGCWSCMGTGAQQQQFSISYVTVSVLKCPCSEVNKRGGSESRERVRVRSLLRDASEQHVVLFYSC